MDKYERSPINIEEKIFIRNSNRSALLRDKNTYVDFTNLRILNINANAIDRHLYIAQRMLSDSLKIN